MRKGADLLSKWVGEAEKQLRLLFEEAQRNQPAIIFFDEIDGLAPVSNCYAICYDCCRPDRKLRITGSNRIIEDIIGSRDCYFQPLVIAVTAQALSCAGAITHPLESC